MIAVVLARLVVPRMAVSTRGRSWTRPRILLAEVFLRPARRGEEYDKEEAGEKVGLDWRLRNAGYCYYTGTLAPQRLRLQTPHTAHL